jgi:3,5-epimerase/4-reductase
MKIMTIGAGFVADHLSYPKIDERISMTLRMDTDSVFIDSVLNRHKPDVLINCIGKTGRPNVDWCEQNREDTALANTALPIVLAEACARHNVHLIQIGSGCIYFGPSRYKGEVPGSKDPGWREEDLANPESYYSKSKYACDLMLGQMKHVSILRIRMPISTKNNQRNLINKLRGYSQVIDIPNSMTFMSDLSRCVDWAARNSKTGIYHVTNPEPITAAQIMQEYQKYVPSHKFEIINESELDKLTVAKRSNCILNSSKLTRAGFTMTPSQEALEQCMAEYVKNI